MTTACGDRASTVFPRGFSMPRVDCVQVGLSDDLARLPPPGGASQHSICCSLGGLYFGVVFPKERSCFFAPRAARQKPTV